MMDRVSAASWIFALLTVAACIFSALIGDMRRAVLGLWAAGLASGAIYLTVGAELLAVLQWVVSTLVALSSIFFVVLVRDNEGAPGDPKSSLKETAIFALPRALVAVAFAVLTWLGTRRDSFEALTIPVEANNLASIGKVLIQQHLLSLQVVAFTLFLILIAGGVIAREEAEKS